MNTLRMLFLLAALGSLVLAPACDDSTETEGHPDGDDGEPGKPGPGGCNDDPWQCQDGQTCWPGVDLSTFVCLNSGQGQIGASCQLIGGQVGCSDDLICLSSSGSAEGVCTPYCDPTDPARACPNAEPCNTYQLPNGLKLQACTPPESPGAGGNGGQPIGEGAGGRGGEAAGGRGGESARPGGDSQGGGGAGGATPP